MSLERPREQPSPEYCSPALAAEIAIRGLGSGLWPSNSHSVLPALKKLVPAKPERNSTHVPRHGTKWEREHFVDQEVSAPLLNRTRSFGENAVGIAADHPDSAHHDYQDHCQHDGVLSYILPLVVRPKLRK